MIVGIGTDIIEISRFADWHLKPLEQLHKVFSLAEIDYCLADSTRSAERFAARFAAKEAFFKAFTQMTSLQIPFFTACKSASIVKNELGAPAFIIEWAHIVPENHPLRTHTIKVHVSLSHAHTMAQAFVILEI